jgi:hypothetical protein
MQERCIHCHKRRGSRRCPALGGTICSRCCGENRLVRIACPETCPHLEQHEAFQRGKQRSRYREAWIAHHADLRKREDILRAALTVEVALAQAVTQVDRVTDADVTRALDEVADYVSPLELIRRSLSPLGKLVWQRLDAELTSGKLGHEDVREALTRQSQVVKALQDSGNPRAFLQGLREHIRLISDSDERQKESEKRLIVTPEDLRDAAG